MAASEVGLFLKLLSVLRMTYGARKEFGSVGISYTSTQLASSVLESETY